MSQHPDAQSNHDEHAENGGTQSSGAPESERDGRDFAGEAGGVSADSVQKAVKATQDFADRGWGGVANGMHSVADAYAPLAEEAVAKGQKFIDSSAKIAGIYQKLTDDTSNDVQALTAAYFKLGQGMLRIQHDYFSALQNSLSRAKRKPQDLLSCKSPSEFVVIQGDLYRDGLAFMVETTTILMNTIGEVSRNATKPLENRGQ